jgi:hypothetical protein
VSECVSGCRGYGALKWGVLCLLDCGCFALAMCTM